MQCELVILGIAIYHSRPLYTNIHSAFVIEVNGPWRALVLKKDHHLREEIQKLARPIHGEAMKCQEVGSCDLSGLTRAPLVNHTQLYHE